MDTSQISAIISERCRDRDSDTELDDLLAAVAEQLGKSVGPDDLLSGKQFVYGYIDQVPYMMEVANTAAANVGLEEPMDTILEMVQSYWIEGDDIIPDELGVIGLLDDAYCSLTSLQAVSDHYRLQTGKFLFPDDLSAANKAMRRLIGEPYCTELDQFCHPHGPGGRIDGHHEGIRQPRKNNWISPIKAPSGIMAQSPPWIWTGSNGWD